MQHCYHTNGARQAVIVPQCRTHILLRYRRTGHPAGTLALLSGFQTVPDTTG